MSFQTPTRTKASSSLVSSSTTRSATTKTSPFFKTEAPNGTQAAQIPIDDDDDEEFPSLSTVTSAQSKKRKRDDSAFIISDDEDDKRTTLRSIPLIGGTPLTQTRAVNKARITAASLTPKPKAKARPKSSPKKSKTASPEKRRRPFRTHAPQTYQTRHERAITQRMFLIDREKKTNSDEYGTYPEEVFDMAGTTGNVYQVTIGKLPKCTCPDAQKNGIQCKHIIYVLVNVLKAPDHLQYQLAFLSNELEQIFANAPASPQSSDGSKEDTWNAGKRKPIEGDCAICMMEFEEGEDLLWCKVACGQNIHKACFEQWAKIKPGEVKCVYCRTPWKGDEETVRVIAKSGKKNAEGYVNVGSQLGLSGRRDTSTYYRSRSRSHWYDQFDYPGDEGDEDDDYEDDDY